MAINSWNNASTIPTTMTTATLRTSPINPPEDAPSRWWQRKRVVVVDDREDYRFM